jgi:hypothetical protein
MIKEQDKEKNISKKRERELMNTALAALTFLAASYNKDYADDDENEPKNEDVDENESVNYDVDRSSAIAE